MLGRRGCEVGDWARNKGAGFKLPVFISAEAPILWKMLTLGGSGFRVLANGRDPIWRVVQTSATTVSAAKIQEPFR